MEQNNKSSNTIIIVLLVIIGVLFCIILVPVILCIGFEAATNSIDTPDTPVVSEGPVYYVSEVEKNGYFDNRFGNGTYEAFACKNGFLFGYNKDSVETDYLGRSYNINMSYKNMTYEYNGKKVEFTPDLDGIKWKYADNSDGHYIKYDSREISDLSDEFTCDRVKIIDDKLYCLLAYREDEWMTRTPMTGDLLICANLKDDQFKVLYHVKSGRQKIIGFNENDIYILAHSKIYAIPYPDKKEIKDFSEYKDDVVYKMPNSLFDCYGVYPYYRFVWHGDVLYVVDMTRLDDVRFIRIATPSVTTKS